MTGGPGAATSNNHKAEDDESNQPEVPKRPKRIRTKAESGSAIKKRKTGRATAPATDEDEDGEEDDGMKLKKD